MRDRYSVIGFTEAELGFVAAILLFAAALSHRGTTTAAHPMRPMPIASAAPAVSLKDYNDLERKYRDAQQSYAKESAKNESLQQAYDREVKSNQVLRDQTRHETDLRSRLTPTCKEKHIADGAIANIQVVGSDEFALDGKTYDLDDLLRHFATQLQQAKSGGCRQVIGVTPGASISTRNFVIGTVRLGTYVYTPLVKPPPVAQAAHGRDAE